ncbi:YdeI/OmpD-associated family protein [Cereibacter sphaeroides]|uniref:YdeI/OmpD-associated family protein n=1 Tax=Cereibacter sphaeroides TaxID=1063 RepID=UPI001F1AA9C5|nr:YdeI/OmpD-associated family protein [Cereibacter sphaeroides]MCE6959846.1 YdeI/OmpD-associated family protein [Cereibacter sphaeroides]MCE6968686.1 YdeI/OmpD-associated family protein [Cereibacter sphaeroides]MCE6974700.1 YdeI/OmpD-associated family protein [Cereibacter sphaeroides]
MPKTNPEVDALLAGLTAWKDELACLRSILLQSALTEDFKWRSPVYTFNGGNVAIIWGFRDRATLGFFKGVLLADPCGMLEPPGEHSRSSRVIGFTDVGQIESARPALLALIAEAIELERSGLKVEFPKDDLDYPLELSDRLDGDPGFRAAFEALTPGRRRGWVLHVLQAKQSATRASRIDRAMPRILAGKGLQDR